MAQLVNNKTIFALVLVQAILVSCGRRHKSSSSDAQASEKEISATIQVETEASSGLNLLATTAAFSGSVAGCLTGKAPAFTDASASVAVLVGDTGCYAKLDTVTVTFGDGSVVAYAPDSSYKFGTGTSLIVSSVSSSTLMRIDVTTNLPSPIVDIPAPSIVMKLKFLTSSGAQTATAQAAAAGVSLGVDTAIPYQLASVGLTVDGTTGGGAFVLNLNCYSNVGADNKCDSLLQTGTVAAIAPDTYLTGLTPRDLTFDECIALANGSGKKSPTSTPLKSDANPSVPNGGAIVRIVGPAPLCAAANSKLVYAVAHSATQSCKFGRLNVVCP